VVTTLKAGGARLFPPDETGRSTLLLSCTETITESAVILEENAGVTTSGGVGSIFCSTDSYLAFFGGVSAMETGVGTLVSLI
jgi:hypothetical protein